MVTDLASVLRRFVALCEIHYPGGEVTVGRFKQFIRQISLGDPRYADSFETAKRLQSRGELESYLSEYPRFSAVHNS
jgi:hypothetical protein